MADSGTRKEGCGPAPSPAASSSDPIIPAFNARSGLGIATSTSKFPVLGSAADAIRLILAWNVRSPNASTVTSTGSPSVTAGSAVSGTPMTIFMRSVLARTKTGDPGPTNEPSSTVFFTMSPSNGATTEVSRRAISASLVSARAACTWLCVASNWARALSKSTFVML